MTRIAGTLYEDRYPFLIISSSFVLRMRSVSDKSCRENENTHFVINNFFKSWLLWNNVEKYCRAGQATDDNMAHSNCMLDTEGNKHTHSVYVILIASPLQQWLHERPSLLRYTYSACLVHCSSQLSASLPTRSLSDLTVLTFVGLSFLYLLLPVSVYAFHQLIPFLSKGYT
jgi:hypothetical protein